jgi:hypothetical protein
MLLIGTIKMEYRGIEFKILARGGIDQWTMLVSPQGRRQIKAEIDGPRDEAIQRATRAIDRLLSDRARGAAVHKNKSGSRRR